MRQERREYQGSRCRYCAFHCVSSFIELGRRIPEFVELIATQHSHAAASELNIATISRRRRPAFHCLTRHLRFREHMMLKDVEGLQKIVAFKRMWEQLSVARRSDLGPLQHLVSCCTGAHCSHQGAQTPARL